MNQPETLLQPATTTADDEFAWMDLLIAVAKHKTRIAGVTLAAAVLASAVSLALPKTYQATTKLVPPQQSQSGAGALLSQLGGIAGVAATGVGLKNPNDLYVGMLKSRTVADRLIAQFKLKQLYDTDSQEKARKALAESTQITSEKDGLITIDVEAKDKKLVAPLANAYVSELFRLMKTLAVTDAAQRRLFYERQLAATKENLANAEMVLKSTMDAHGVVSVDSESRAIVETVARLKAQVSAKEIELTAMRAFLTQQHPDYRRAEEELGGLRSELAKLENGSGNEPAGADKQGGLKNIKLLRELKYQQMLYEALAKQYEVARMDEARDPSIVQVLDPAVEPERKSKPHSAVIVLVSTALAFFAAVGWALLLEWRRKGSLTPERAAQWAELNSHLRFKR